MVATPVPCALSETLERRGVFVWVGEDARVLTVGDALHFQADTLWNAGQIYSDVVSGLHFSVRCAAYWLRYPSQ